jgi:hypothetical protein
VLTPATLCLDMSQYGRFSKLSRVVILFIIMQSIITSNALSAEYTNDNYLFSFRYPDNMTACGAIPPNPNHGTILLLDGGQCKFSPDGSQIQVSAEYNVPYEAPDSESLGKHLCQDAQIYPTQYKVAGNTLLMCTVAGSAPLEHSILFFLKKGEPQSDPLGWICYTVHVFQFKKDKMRVNAVLQKVITSMRVHERE